MARLTAGLFIAMTFKGQTMEKQPIGAYATVQWIDDSKSEYSDVYFSFGQYIEETEKDSFGVSDSKIFYYAEGLEDLDALKNSIRDFKVISYSLEFLPDRAKA